jgi:hypothetical protein
VDTLKCIVFICSLFSSIVSCSDYIASDDPVISELWIWDQMEGSGRGIIMLSWNFSAVTAGSHENLGQDIWAEVLNLGFNSTSASWRNSSRFMEAEDLLSCSQVLAIRPCPKEE